jgi:hypothetical protein
MVAGVLARTGRSGLKKEIFQNKHPKSDEVPKQDGLVSIR